MSRIFVGSLFSLLFAASALAGEPSSVFLPGRYSHDPATGERVNQFLPEPQLPALPDASQVSSGYRQSRTTERGADGSYSNYYRVENYGNGRGGLDAQWERVNDVWQHSIQGAGTGYGAWQGYPPGYGYGGGYGAGYGGGFYGQPYPTPFPVTGYPGGGYPGYGAPGGGGGYPPGGGGYGPGPYGP